MSKKNRKKFSKNERTQREFKRQREARERKEATPTTFSVAGAKVKSYLNAKTETLSKVELTSIQVDADRKQVVHVDESGVRTVSDIEEIRLMDPSSQAWKEYVRAGGDPNIPEDEVPIQVITRDTKTGASDGIGVATAPANALGMLSAYATDVTGKWIDTTAQNNHVESRNIPHVKVRASNEILPLIVESIHPDTRRVMPSTEALTLLTNFPAIKEKIVKQGEELVDGGEKLIDQAINRVKHAASLDPNAEILVKQMMDRPTGADENLSLFYSSLSEADISPGVDNKELNLVYNLLTDTATRRIRFDQLNYPVWEGHTTHPTRNEGFITKPPFSKMYIQFNGLVDLPPMESDFFALGSEIYTPDYTDLSSPEKMSITIGAIAFSDEIQHLLIRKNSNGTARTILPQEGKTWKITPPQGTKPEHHGYSAGQHDSIMLGYLQWFGLLMDENRQGLSKINQGAYFDINTGAIWLPLTKITGGQSGVGCALDAFQMEKNRMSTHLIPAGSGIESSVLSAGWDSNRKLNIFEDTAMRVGDIFMFMMNYMTSPRMQTEEVQVNRGERRRAQKQGLPPPPPWTTISYKPPSSIKRNSVATGTGSKHSYMYDVRGHWKNQPHGPGREQRKLIWVHPHYSGLANETYIPRNRLVEEKEEYEA